jgi:hypothetical protein
LFQEHPTGARFRTPRGAKWSPTSVGNTGKWLMRRPAAVKYCQEHSIVPQTLKPYFLRHPFLSRWVEDGGDIHRVASLCGASVTMVEKRRRHPNVDKPHERYL